MDGIDRGYIGVIVSLRALYSVICNAYAVSSYGIILLVLRSVLTHSVYQKYSVPPMKYLFGTD